ncbi:MAG: hypothetical protein AAF004_14355 [Pseudomonadota bacterium]
MNSVIQSNAGFFVVFTLTLTLLGCSSALPNRDPTGERFPTAIGESLQGETITLPDALAGEPAVLLVGYKQDTQFDIDRWILGLAQVEADVRLLELPTIPGMVASMASGFIDNGMRSGIPEEDWKVVVTLYGGAAKPVANFTGTENGNNARVLVLDAAGTVVWFSDNGYSASKVLAVAALTEKLAAGERQ